ncbi:alpha amylase family protein [Pseudogracilibacillus sp. SE30717A]|uniref:alpha amylase family protein n=1 Tax=Pseudogracilibacillus sp. SE30717A TaxID=3098293 RepID=UPI00300E2D82
MLKRILIFFLSTVILFTSLGGISSIEAKANDNAKRNLIKNKNMKARILWYDLSANLENLNTPEKVANIISKTADANFNTIVLDVKSSTGFVPYPSEYSPHLSTSKNPKYQGYPADFDLIENVVREAKKYDLEVHLNINTFAAGSNQYAEGPAIENPEWQTVVYDVTRVVTDSEENKYSIAGFDITRNSDQLIIYTPENNTISPANRWGIEVKVENGIVTEIIDRNTIGEQEVTVPKNGYLISAHGKARQWVLDNIQINEEIDISQVQSDLRPTSETNATETFMNPINPEVQQFTWNIISELVTNYDIDGITLDRARYNNIYTDFSDLSRTEFEKEIGQKVTNWPEDIFTVKFEDNKKVTVPGKHYKEWIKWRAANIEKYFEETSKLVKSQNSDVLFNTYVGSWHPLYYSEGVNWGSKNYQPDYEWATPDYHETGYADHLDFLMTGLYYGDVTIEESDAKGLPYWYSVEGAADLSMEVTNYETFTYGSLYLLDYQDRPESFKEAIRMTESKTHGVMLFDLVYIEMYDWWPLLEEVFTKETVAPHTIPGLN